MNLEISDRQQTVHHRRLLAVTVFVCILNEIICGWLTYKDGFPTTSMINLALILIGAAVQFWIFADSLFGPTDQRTFSQIPRPAIYLGSHHFEKFKKLDIFKQLSSKDYGWKLAIAFIAFAIIISMLGLGHLYTYIIGFFLARCYARAHFFLPVIISSAGTLFLAIRIIPGDSLALASVSILILTGMVLFSAVYRNIWEEFLGPAPNRPPITPTVQALGIFSALILVSFLILRTDSPSPKKFQPLQSSQIKIERVKAPQKSPTGDAAKPTDSRQKTSSPMIARRPSPDRQPPRDQANDRKPDGENAPQRFTKPNPPPESQAPAEIHTIPLWMLVLFAIVIVVLLSLVVRFLRRMESKNPAVQKKPATRVQKARARRQLAKQLQVVRRTPPETDDDRITAVIQLYNELLEHRKSCGFAKPESATPDEYYFMYHHLGQFQARALQNVTGTFVLAKYRHTAPTPEGFETYVKAISALGLAA